MPSTPPAANPKTVSQSTAIAMAVASFAFGVLVSFFILPELRSAPQGTGTPSAKSAPQAQASAAADRLAPLEFATVQNPDDPQVWIALGNGAFDAGMFRKAINAYERGLKLGGPDANVLTDLGVMYRRVGNPQRAVQSFAAAVKADPAHRIARLNMGVVRLHDLEDVAGAVAIWKELLAIDPGATAPGGQPMAEVVADLEAQLTAAGPDDKQGLIPAP